MSSVIEAQVRFTKTKQHSSLQQHACNPHLDNKIEFLFPTGVQRIRIFINMKNRFITILCANYLFNLFVCAFYHQISFVHMYQRSTYDCQTVSEWLMLMTLTLHIFINVGKTSIYGHCNFNWSTINLSLSAQWISNSILRSNEILHSFFIIFCRSDWRVTVASDYRAVLQHTIHIPAIVAGRWQLVRVTLAVAQAIAADTDHRHRCIIRLYSRIFSRRTFHRRSIMPHRVRHSNRIMVH